jgi:ABC-type nitrate/sulfonate/bicarbonate transport system substrate-binding protein
MGKPQRGSAERIDRRGFIQRAAGFGAGAMTVLVADRRAAAAPISFTYVTPFGFLIGYAPVLVAKAGGFFEQQGLDVTIYGGRGSAQAVQQILSGQALLSRAGGSDLIKAVANQQAPILSIGVVCQGSPFLMVSHKDKPIHAPKDMIGKSIGVVTRGGSVENLLDTMLVNDGLDPTKVERNVVGNAPGAFGLIEQGRIDGLIISVGSVVTLRMEGAPIVAWNTDEHAPVPGQVYVTSKEATVKQPETIVRFLKAVFASMAAITADHDGEKTLALLKVFEIAEMKNLAIAKAGLFEEAKLWDSAGVENRLRHRPEHWQHARDLLAKAKLVPAGSAAICYTNEFVDQARA